jgi:hypothetical protein
MAAEHTKGIVRLQRVVISGNRSHVSFVAIACLAFAVSAACAAHAEAARAAVSRPVNIKTWPKDELAEAQRAYERGEKGKSFQGAFKAARSGYVPAFAVLGTHYAVGIGTEIDKVKAVFWFQKSAVAGDTLGQYQLAIAYLNGDGIAEDLGSALKWAQSSAQANHPGAAGLADHIRGQLGPDASTCVGYGFKLSTDAFSQCVMQLNQVKQQAQFEQRQYELQVAQYQQQVTAYQQELAMQQEAIKKERERRKWEMIGRIGAGMMNSTSPTFLGGLSDGISAGNGYPVSRPAPVPPLAPVSQNYTIRLPNGEQVYCNYNTAASYMSCR